MVDRVIAFIKKMEKKDVNIHEDLLDRRGREQLKVMRDRGIDLPIVLLN